MRDDGLPCRGYDSKFANSHSASGHLPIIGQLTSTLTRYNRGKRFSILHGCSTASIETYTSVNIKVQQSFIPLFVLLHYIRHSDIQNIILTIKL